jgi:hypothetical protein
MNAHDVFLRFTPIVDGDHPKVRALAHDLAGGQQDPTAVARVCFDWVKHEIRHTVDYQCENVTCSASDVLRERTGFCYAKSHLLAALLRANRIPAGFVYQRLALDNRGSAFCLHGLNAVWLADVGWYRVDARGQRDDLKAEFDPPREVLPYTNGVRGEQLFPQIAADPLPLVIDSLRRYRTRTELERNLPDDININPK